MEWRNKRNNQYVNMLRKAGSILVFDVETTGLGKKAKIIQFSAIIYDVDREALLLKERERVDLYINPEEKLSKTIIEKIGITDEMVADAPKEKDVAFYIIKIMKQIPLWAAYNCKFDIGMVSNMAERQGIPFVPNVCFDILEMARDMIMPSEIENFKLESVIKHTFEDKKFLFHSAIEDVCASALFLEWAIGQYKNLEPEVPKRNVYVRYAAAYVSSHSERQNRIRVCLGEGDYGDIYWDIEHKVWTHKKNKKAEKLFSEVNIADIERQVMNRYGYRYQTFDMTQLAKSMIKEKKERQKIPQPA